MIGVGVTGKEGDGLYDGVDVGYGEGIAWLIEGKGEGLMMIPILLLSVYDARCLKS